MNKLCTTISLCTKYIRKIDMKYIININAITLLTHFEKKPQSKTSDTLLLFTGYKQNIRIKQMYVI